MGYNDDIGSLEIADYVGARRRARRGARRGEGMPSRALVSRIPGRPEPGMRLQPLGMGSTAFTSTSGTLLQLTALPQKPFKGQRFIVDLTRTGATATGLVTIARLDVGADNQLPGSGAVSANAFSPLAVDANVSLDPATPGVSIIAQFNISAAPTTTDRVDIGATIFGTTFGG